LSISEALILGLIQGLTEFLPVSSSGHLVLARSFLGVSSGGVTFEVAVHFATMLVIITVFWRRISGMAVSLPAFIRSPSSSGGERRTPDRTKDMRWIVAVILGTIPAGIVGIVFRDPIEAMFSKPGFASLSLIVTGAILISTKFVRGRGRELKLIDSIPVGLAQAFAIMPGISRSGSTIAAGLWSGMSRGEAAEFSFVLALPAIAGATLMEVGDFLSIAPSEVWPYISGAAAAYISGYLAVRSLLRVVRGGKLDLFAYYCFGAGAVGLFLSNL